LLKSERFTHEPTHSVAHDGSRRKALWNDQREPGVGERIRQTIHAYSRAAGPLAGFEHGGNLRRAQPLRAREPQASGQALLDTEADAPLGTTRADHGTPTARAHPHEKSMRPLAPDH